MPAKKKSTTKRAKTAAIKATDFIGTFSSDQLAPSSSHATIETLVSVPPAKILYLSRAWCSSGVTGEEFMYIVCTTDFQILTCEYSKGTMSAGYTTVGHERTYTPYSKQDMAKYRTARIEYESAQGLYLNFRYNLASNHNFAYVNHEVGRTDDEHIFNLLAVTYFQPRSGDGGVVLHTPDNFVTLGATSKEGIGQYYQYGANIDFSMFIYSLLGRRNHRAIQTANFALYDVEKAKKTLRESPSIWFERTHSRREENSKNMHSNDSNYIARDRDIARAKTLLENFKITAAKLNYLDKHPPAHARLVKRVGDIAKVMAAKPK